MASKNPAQDIYSNLPHLDCGDCGMKDCVEFAKSLLKLKDVKKISDCPHLTEEQNEAVAIILDEYFNF